MHVRPTLLGLAAAVASLVAAAAAAKPIAYARGHTAMAEYGAGTMGEAQWFYAPRHWWSVGAGALRLDSSDGRVGRDLSYLRLNLLARRWNLPAAQANVFAWGGLGQARRDAEPGRDVLRNAGVQFDYETRRVYAALKFDRYDGAGWRHRIDTLQLGVAPYAHDYGDLATWFVLQARDYDDALYRGVEWAGLVRLFKGGVWVEAGVTLDGKPQLMLMLNF